MYLLLTSSMCTSTVIRFLIKSNIVNFRLSNFFHRGGIGPLISYRLFPSTICRYYIGLSKSTVSLVHNITCGDILSDLMYYSDMLSFSV